MMMLKSGKMMIYKLAAVYHISCMLHCQAFIISAVHTDWHHQLYVKMLCTTLTLNDATVPTNLMDDRSIGACFRLLRLYSIANIVDFLPILVNCLTLKYIL